MAVHISAARNWTSPVTDADLQEHLTTVGNALDAVGLVRTTDSGQFDPSTALRASVPASSSSEAFYELRYLNDSLAGTAPVLVKIAYYANSLLTMNFRVGTATNGAGTFVGASYFVEGKTANSSSTVPFYATGGEGYAGFWLPVSRGDYGLFIARVTDHNGDPTGEGFRVYHRSLGSSYDLATVDYRDDIRAMSYKTAPDYTFVPQGRLSSLNPSAALDVYRHYSALPDPRVCPYAVTVHKSEHTEGVTFTTDPIQGQVHTFMPVMQWIGADACYPGSNRDNIMAVRWES